MAVKVLCHEGSRTAKLNALHESVVCAHVQHPNVVSSDANGIGSQSVQSICCHAALLVELTSERCSSLAMHVGCWLASTALCCIQIQAGIGVLTN